MRELVIAILISGLSAGRAGAQTPAADHVRSHATIRHGADSVTLEANSPRPLQQAVDALVKEYGWIIDYEDPPYFSRRDAVDATAAAWRAEHSNAKGVTRINGGPFHARYAEDADPNDAAREERVLDSRARADGGPRTSRGPGGGPSPERHDDFGRLGPNEPVDPFERDCRRRANTGESHAPTDHCGNRDTAPLGGAV
jgi:hypothetical protein